MKTFKEFSMTEKVKWDKYDTPYGGRHGKEFDKRLSWETEKEKYKKSQKPASLKKESIVEFDSPTIYCDMDGVIADFVKFTSTHLGHPFKDEYWKDLPDDLFYQLPLMPDAKKLWGFISKYNPFILHRNLKEFNYPLFVCVDKHIAKQYIDNPNGQELWGELDFTDYTLNDLKENKQLNRCNPCVF